MKKKSEEKKRKHRKQSKMGSSAHVGEILIKDGFISSRRRNTKLGSKADVAFEPNKKFGF